jgi:hypothetical protein
MRHGMTAAVITVGGVSVDDESTSVEA